MENSFCLMPKPAAAQVSPSSIQGKEFPRRHMMNNSFSFKELRGAIRAWRRYGFFSLTPREAEIIDAVYSRLGARPLSRTPAGR
jgi:hypothetical protein